MSAYKSDFLFDYGYPFRPGGEIEPDLEELDMGQLVREAPQ